MCIDTLESTTNSLVWFLRRGCQHYPSFGGRERGLVLIFWAYRHVSPHPMPLFVRIVLVAKIPQVFYPQILEPTEFGPVHIFAWLLAMDPFSPKFLRGANVPLENFGMIRSQFSNTPQNWFFCGLSWDTQPICIVSFQKATDPYPPLFFLFLLGPNLIVSNLTNGHHICIPIQTCNLGIRKGATNRTWFVLGLLPSFCVGAFGARGRLCSLSTITSVDETARVSSWTRSI